MASISACVSEFFICSARADVSSVYRTLDMAFKAQPNAKTPIKTIIRTGAISANSNAAPPDAPRMKALVLANTDHLLVSELARERKRAETEGR